MVAFLCQQFFHYTTGYLVQKKELQTISHELINSSVPLYLSRFKNKPTELNSFSTINKRRQMQPRMQHKWPCNLGIEQQTQPSQHLKACHVAKLAKLTKQLSSSKHRDITVMTYNWWLWNRTEDTPVLYPLLQRRWQHLGFFYIQSTGFSEKKRICSTAMKMHWLGQTGKDHKTYG